MIRLPFSIGENFKKKKKKYQLIITNWLIWFNRYLNLQ